MFLSLSAPAMTDNIDARLVMCLGKGKQHGRYWMANSVIDNATTPTLSQI
jgi:hypothetical protein